MTERAAHLVDAVLPWVPVRQWVLTVPFRLRYRMAFDHGLSRAVLAMVAWVLGDAYARRATACGMKGGRTGMVTALQRAGGALNVNLHFHSLVLGGRRPPAGRSPPERANVDYAPGSTMSIPAWCVEVRRARRGRPVGDASALGSWRIASASAASRSALFLTARSERIYGYGRFSPGNWPMGGEGCT